MRRPRRHVAFSGFRTAGVGTGSLKHRSASAQRRGIAYAGHGQRRRLASADHRHGKTGNGRCGDKRVQVGGGDTLTNGHVQRDRRGESAREEAEQLPREDEPVV